VPPCPNLVSIRLPPPPSAAMGWSFAFICPLFLFTFCVCDASLLGKSFGVRFTYGLPFFFPPPPYFVRFFCWDLFLALFFHFRCSPGPPPPFPADPLIGKRKTLVFFSALPLPWMIGPTSLFGFAIVSVLWGQWFRRSFPPPRPN